MRKRDFFCEFSQIGKLPEKELVKALRHVIPLIHDACTAAAAATFAEVMYKNHELDKYFAAKVRTLRLSLNERRRILDRVDDRSITAKVLCAGAGRGILRLFVSERRHRRKEFEERRARDSRKPRNFTRHFYPPSVRYAL